MVTTIASIPQTHTSVLVSISMDMEPKSVVHTSPDTFEELGNRFIIIYPKASAPTDSIAIAASPFILVFCPFLRRSIANTIVIGSTIIILFVKLSIVAIANAPKATWDNPSPINEYLFKTSVTPSSDEQRAISTPTIRAYLTKGKLIYSINVSSMLLSLHLHHKF